jgi:hypothetical protein
MSTIISSFAVDWLGYRILTYTSGRETLAKTNITGNRKSRPFHNLAKYCLCFFRHA